MKIAVCTTPQNPVPPVKYGGAEKRADIIVRKMMGRGHIVHLYCGPGSTCPADWKFEATSTKMSAQREYIPPILDIGYDAILDMTSYHIMSWPKGAEKDIRPVALMAGDPHKKYPHDTIRNRVYVSKEFAAFNGCPNHPIVHNIIHECPESVAYEYGEPPERYAFYLGIIRPEKGLHIAAKACRKLGLKFKVGGPILDETYWAGIEPLDGVEYLGLIDNDSEEKWKLFGQASVFLYPALWCDAGPLAPMESLLAGTPVVGFANGGICSDVQDDINGWLRPKNMALDYISMIRHTLELDLHPGRVQKSILKAIDPDKCVTKLLKLLKRAASGEEW